MRGHQQEIVEDYPQSPVPSHARRGFFPTSVILLGFTFFSATMWGGGAIGVAFPFWPDLIAIIVFGNLLLAGYVAGLAYVSQRSGLNTALLGRYCFGRIGSRWPDLVLGFTQVGWYAWGTATIAILFTELLNLEAGWRAPLMILFGFTFCWTAFIGYRGLERLSMVSVPLMCALIVVSMAIATRDGGGIAGIAAIVPATTMGVGEAVTIVVGTFISGGTQATNWTRFSDTPRTAVGAALLAFLLGNGLMVLVGAYGALVYGESDIVRVLELQGMLGLGVAMLFLNLWTTQDNTIYNFSVAGCDLARTNRRRVITLLGAAVGTALALLGMYDWLVPYMQMLGTVIPPIGGIILADYCCVHRRGYPPLDEADRSAVHPTGILAYIAASVIAAFSPGIPPLNGIVAAFVLYWIGTGIMANRRSR
ncbi:cytosine permease [Methanofollis fontis]|uniref:Cytosine permease n=1 Tax=Methanofollis fontis TaxID=2052832 RepID=A0A483CRY3_9EURY|nr:cytosine permease [Methanofollis fontis]TAJ43805.1 cytosine permease [Methanofollis fontis]